MYHIAFGSGFVDKACWHAIPADC